MKKKSYINEDEYRFGLLAFSLIILVGALMAIFISWWAGMIVIGTLLFTLAIMTLVNSTQKGNPLKRSLRQLGMMFEMIGYLG